MQRPRGACGVQRHNDGACCCRLPWPVRILNVLIGLWIRTNSIALTFLRLRFLQKAALVGENLNLFHNLSDKLQI